MSIQNNRRRLNKIFILTSYMAYMFIPMNSGYGWTIRPDHIVPASISIPISQLKELVTIPCEHPDAQVWLTRRILKGLTVRPKT
jgi:hypothetical protein